MPENPIITLTNRLVTLERKLADLNSIETRGWSKDYTLTALAASVTFSDIPSVYRHATLRIMARTNKAAVAYEKIGIQFNGDAGANYDNETLYRAYGATVWTQTSAVENQASVAYVNAATSTANFYTDLTIDIPGYGDSAFIKRWSYVGALTTSVGVGWNQHMSGYWNSTVPITSILIYGLSGGSFKIGSRFTLYLHG